MVRKWATIMHFGREIERPVHMDGKGNEYVVIKGKKRNLKKIEDDGRLENRYQFGHEDEAKEAVIFVKRSRNIVEKEKEKLASAN